jgi:hypothetical protein
MTDGSLGVIDTLGMLWAERAIRRCLYDYCRGIDQRDEALVVSTYHPDAVDRHPPYEGLGADFPAVAFASFTELGVVMSSHQITNCRAEVRGDSADVMSYFLTTLLKRATIDDYEVAIIAGRLADRFECRGGAWKVADRTALVDVDSIAPYRPMYPPTVHTHRFERMARPQ